MCNNGTESNNAVLKRITNWEPLPILSLIEKIKQLSASEDQEIHRMICGRGKYVMKTVCKNLTLKHPSVWKNMSNQESHILKLFKRVDDKKKDTIEVGDPSSISDVPKVAKKPGTASARGSKTRSLKKKRETTTIENQESADKDMKTREYQTFKKFVQSMRKK
jgi:hypothetical protein